MPTLSLIDILIIFFMVNAVIAPSLFFADLYCSVFVKRNNEVYGWCHKYQNKKFSVKRNKSDIFWSWVVGDLFTALDFYVFVSWAFQGFWVREYQDLSFLWLFSPLIFIYPRYVNDTLTLRKENELLKKKNGELNWQLRK